MDNQQGILAIQDKPCLHFDLIDQTLGSVSLMIEQTTKL